MRATGVLAGEVRGLRDPTVRVAGMGEDPHALGLASLVRARDLEAVVGRAIVHHHHLDGPVGLSESAVDCGG